VFINQIRFAQRTRSRKNCMSNLRTPLFVALAAIFVFGSIALAGNDWKPIEPPAALKPNC